MNGKAVVTDPTKTKGRLGAPSHIVAGISRSPLTAHAFLDPTSLASRLFCRAAAFLWMMFF